MADPLGFLASVLRGTVNGATEAGQGLVQGAMDAATLPRDVYQGKVQTDPRYMSDEEFARTLNLAGNVAGGGITTGAAPEGAIGMFAGRRSKTFPWTEAIAADIGEQMGKHPTDIYKNTGLFRGVDDKLRYEIPDQAARIKDPGNLMDGDVLHAKDYLDHPELFKAYPELAEMPVMHQPNMTGASYTPAYTNKAGNDVPATLRMDMTKNWQGSDQMQPRSMMLHELQHGIQAIEKFAPGPGGGMNAPEIVNANPIRMLQNKYMETLANGTGPDKQYAKHNLEYNKYRDYARSAGEVEARQVQERADWSPQKRMEMHPVQQQMTPAFPGDKTARFNPDEQWIPGKQLPYGTEYYDESLPFLAQYLGK
jgi:hypothetical protein